MIFFLCCLLILFLSAIPLLLIVRNLRLFQPACQDLGRGGEPVSVLIPARNEAAGIEDTCQRVLSNRHPQFEVIVVDDHSTDGTGEILAGLCQRDSRLQVASSQPLPDGWNGKQFACWQLSQLATYDRLLFLDADVKIQPDCLQRICAELAVGDVDLLSGFPRQQVIGLSEKMLIPMMYFVLLGYLPLDQMRTSRSPEFGAGCGQMFLAKRRAYEQADGHRSIRDSRHDGIKLPRSFRQAGFSTDLFDASDIASVRMYEGTTAVLSGLLKNANEGIATPKLIWIFSFLLLGGSLLPILYLSYFLVSGALASEGIRGGIWSKLSLLTLIVATVFSFLGPALIAIRLKLSSVVFLLHPLSVAWFVSLQWLAFIRECFGMKPVAWRGRSE